VRLRRLQCIRFDVGLGITRPLTELAQALRQNLVWIREHTRIADLATRWEARGRPSSLLLRDDDLDAAKSWAGKWTSEAPEITDVQTAFLNASIVESRVVRRRRLLVQTLFGVLVVCIVLGLIGWLTEDQLREAWHEFVIVGPYKQKQILPYVLTPERIERAFTAGQSFRECANDCPEMIVVQAGEFMMGSPTTEKGRYDDEDEGDGRQHRVGIAKQFAVSKFEVTFSDWDRCVSLGGCPKDARAGDAGWGRGTRPVIYVGWDDAQRYVAWLSRMAGKVYRLLTEAEWEYAARAGKPTAYSWGDEIGKDNANCNGCGSEWDNRKTAPVGSFVPNAFGLYDMHGNVWEWVEDCYHDNYNGAPLDGTAWIAGDCKYRVVRGGSWMVPPQVLRTANRRRYTPGDRDPDLGFRVGRTLTP
jgi:formylglycine-generating enzyme required for sulfatase activity